VNKHCFYTSAFSISCFVLFVMDAKIEQHVCIEFWAKLGKSATETLKMLCEDLGEYSLCQTAASRESVEDDERSG
jgi:hypothetical protein